MEELLAMTPAQIVEFARGINEKAAAIVDFARETYDGIFIWGDRVEWSEIDETAKPS